ncbi:hypothetical protein CY34DRAFT_87193 [Suillus luteus UH-Slu-Lm8-n1]|uniref:Uncharacterized protein n=1 Tax=Suillus luteus UH-Slu-Lm8-n1 TaxID=930992 RepID=A0A0D0BAE1_9AGAM|nr:hypothetical protein CY34DRAFT_87193 [Suillus luteus UH-Slu-Lm8-n1]
MVAVLEAHDQFVVFPTADSEDVCLACEFTESRTCPEWSGGFLAIDGSTIDLYIKSGLYGEVFYNRKSKYSLGCQAICFSPLSSIKKLI